MTVLTDAEYVATGGGVCPHCGSDAIEGDSIEVDGSGASQEVSCNDCDRRWVDVYELKGWIAN